jgi:hypothetical protein
MQRFRPGEIFDGMVINIDDEALRIAVSSMKPVAGGEALFEVGDIVSPTYIDDEGIYKGNYAQYEDKNEVRVTITRFTAKQRRQIKKQGLPKIVPDDYRNMPAPSAATRGDTQSTAFHELRHLVDSIDETMPALIEKDKHKVAAREKLYKRGIIASERILYGLIGVSVGGTVGVVTASPFILLGSGIAGGVAGFLYSGRRKVKKQTAQDADRLMEYYTYQASLKEKRASAAGRMAKRYPQIISIDPAP